MASPRALRAEDAAGTEDKSEPASGTPDSPAPGAPPKPEPPKPPAGGYSWSEAKPSKPGRRKRNPEPPVDPNAALVTYPGFQLLSQGKSQLFVLISRSVPIRMERKGAVVSFFLEGARVAVANNTNPLITAHFSTPLVSARLIPEKGGAKLVLVLREQIDVVHRLADGPRGSKLLEVALPAPTQKYKVPEIARPLQPAGEAMSSARTRSTAASRP